MNEARIASINLETGKRSEVSTTVYGYSAKCILLDVDENNCYFERIYSDEPFSMENATTRKYLCEIYCYDKKSKEEKEIILPQKQVRELCIWNQTAIYIAGDTEESRLYQMELNTGETTELTVPGFTAALSLYGDDLFFYTGKWGQSEHVQHHIDLNTMVDSKIPEKEDATQQLFVRNTYKSLFLISIGNTNEMGWCSRETYLLQTGEYYQIRESD